MLLSKLKHSGDHLTIAKETGRRLGMGVNMYPSSALLGQHKEASLESIPVDELIEKADGFAGVFPGTNTSVFFFIFIKSNFFSVINFDNTGN